MVQLSKTAGVVAGVAVITPRRLKLPIQRRRRPRKEFIRTLPEVRRIWLTQRECFPPRRLMECSNRESQS